MGSCRTFARQLHRKITSRSAPHWITKSNNNGTHENETLKRLASFLAIIRVQIEYGAEEFINYGIFATGDE